MTGHVVNDGFLCTNCPNSDVTAVESAARRAVEDAEILRLSAEDQVRFAKALIAPRTPVAALKRAAKRHRDMTGPR